MYAEVVIDRVIIRRVEEVESPEDNHDAPELNMADFPTEADAPARELMTTANPFDTTFHYNIPSELRERLEIGQLVAVPFRTEMLQAIIVGFSKTSPFEHTRPLLEILDITPVVSPAQIQLARWLSAEYLTPLASCLRLFLPSGSNRKPEYILKPMVVAHDNHAAELLDAPSQILLTYLRQKGSVRWAETNPKSAQILLDLGLIYKESVLTSPTVGPKVERTVELIVSPDEVPEILPTLGRPSKQAEILRHLMELDDPLPELAEVLAQVGCGEGVAKTLADKGYVAIIPKETRLDLSPYVRAHMETPPDLTPSQQTLLHYLAAQHQPTLLEEALAATHLEAREVTSWLKQDWLVAFHEPARLVLQLPPDEFVMAMLELRHAHKHAEVLKLLSNEEGAVWIGWIYAQTTANLNTLRDLAKAEYIRIDEARRWRDPLAGKIFTLDTPPILTPEQQIVWETVDSHLKAKRTKTPPAPILLYGVTGSGKTEIYLRAIEACLKAGQEAIMLVPEITLATQVVARVSARFPHKVAVWHSAMSPGERYDNWDRVRHGELPIVVGPRSALFAPLQNLGVIILDEEHDQAYKQGERLPLYHARDTAIELARLTGALVILGSASPDVETYRKAERGEYQLLSLPKRMLAHTQHLLVQKGLLKRQKSHSNGNGHGRLSQPKPSEDNALNANLTFLPLPKVEIVDLRQELKVGNRSIFSRALQTAMAETLQRGEQIILFLNRRGAATFVNCRDCGYVQRCPQCDTSLTYHADGEKLTCHYCGYRQPPAHICPECESKRIRYFGLGTQRVEEAVQQLFPQATVVRWDQDTSRKHGSHEVFLQHFMSGQAHIMVGTQMVTKGLDLPLVTLVGVISADTALYLPDFRASERTFQLLMQVAGRAGRSPLGGKVIIQTYTPDLPVIKAAARHDYANFYQMELAFRREQQYPPFKRLAVLHFSGSGEERSMAEAQRLAERLRLYVERMGWPAVEVIGPTPHYVYRLRSQYRWFILVRAANPPEVLRPMMPLPYGWKVDVDPVSMI